MKKLIEEALEVILSFDMAGRITYYNKAAGKELGLEEKNAFSSVADILKTEFEGKAAEEVLKSGNLFQIESTVLYRSNLTCFTAAVRFIENQRKDGYFLMAVSQEAKEILEHEIIKMKEENEKIFQIKNEFVANVTHELRTPVNGIKGHVSNLKESVLTKEQREALDIIDYCCRDMSSIINNILDFSKIEAGKLELDEREFDFYKMMDHVVGTNITAVNEKGLRLMVHIDENIPQLVIGDELRLSQILNNLLSNAVKFTSIGYIKIEVIKTLLIEDEIELFFMVVDTGIGISQEEKEHLFRSFSQVDASITRKYGGTGLGLAITKELVEMMQGSVYLESTKGQGSNFSFSIRLHVKLSKKRQQDYQQIYQFLGKLDSIEEEESMEDVYRYGTKKNRQEINNKLEKLIICIEMGVWGKAEICAEDIKKLIEGAERETKRAVLKMEMAIRKEDYDTSTRTYEVVKKLLMGESGGN